MYLKDVNQMTWHCGASVVPHYDHVPVILGNFEDGESSEMKLRTGAIN